MKYLFLLALLIPVLSAATFTAKVGQVVTLYAQSTVVGDYQWYKNGQIIPTANAQRYSFTTSSAITADYTVTVTSTAGTILAKPVTIATKKSRISNSSIRATTTPADPLIAGIVVAGTEPKKVLIRAAGPALASFGVKNAATDVSLSVFDSTGKMIAHNEEWSSDDSAQFAAVGAFQYKEGSHDSAIVIELMPGVYTAHATTADGKSGQALLEVYDTEQETDN